MLEFVKVGSAALLLATIGVVGIATNAGATPPSAQNFMPEFMGVMISPDGERVAVIRPHDGRNAVVIYRFDDPPGEGGSETLVVPSGEGLDILSASWAGDRQLLIWVGFAHQNVDNYRRIDFDRFGTHLMSLDISSGRLTNYTDLNYASVVDALPDDPDHIMIQEWYSGFLRPALMNIHNGGKDYLGRGPRAGGRFVLDSRDRPRAMLSVTPSVARILWRRAGGASWHEAYQFPVIGGQEAFPIGILEHSNVEYLYLTSDHEGRTGIYRYKLEGGSGLEQVYLNDQYDALTLRYNPVSGSRHYVSFIDDVYQRHYFRQRVRQLDEALNEYIPGDYAFAMGSSSDGNRHVVQSFSAGRPTNFYLYDIETGQLNFFAPQYLGLDEERLANVRRFDYVARDGLEIPSYLVVPQGMEEGPQPLLVWPHGGPFVRDNMMFEPTRQYLASAGVLVFSPNFRGSPGYGNEFRSAGVGEWGGKMQTDVIDGVRALIEQGIADPDRICIGGWSYGAYVALFAAVETPELFQCAIGVNGVYDLVEFSAEFGQRSNFGISDAYRTECWGDAAHDRDALRRMSPTHRADEINIPTLIIASAEDPVVDVAQAEDLIEALRNAGKEPQTLMFEEGDHSMGFGQSRVRTYEAMGEFLQEHLN